MQDGEAGEGREVADRRAAEVEALQDGEAGEGSEVADLRAAEIETLQGGETGEGREVADRRAAEVEALQCCEAGEGARSLTCVPRDFAGVRREGSRSLTCVWATSRLCSAVRPARGARSLTGVRMRSRLCRAVRLAISGGRAEASGAHSDRARFCQPFWPPRFGVAPSRTARPRCGPWRAIFSALMLASSPLVAPLQCANEQAPNSEPATITAVALI